MKISVNMKSMSAASPLTALKREAIKLADAATKARSLIADAELLEAKGKDINKKVAQIEKALSAFVPKLPARPSYIEPKPPKVQNKTDGKPITAEQRAAMEEVAKRSTPAARKAMLALRKRLIAGGVLDKQISVERYGMMGLGQDLVARQISTNNTQYRAPGLVIREQADGTYLVALCIGPGVSPEFIGKTTKCATFDALLKKVKSFTSLKFSPKFK